MEEQLNTYLDEVEKRSDKVFAASREDLSDSWNMSNAFSVLDASHDDVLTLKPMVAAVLEYCGELEARAEGADAQAKKIYEETAAELRSRLFNAMDQ